ncbi:MAG: exonuclease SbcCD subunit D C-terminal domain-containing protein [Zoogloeaceae bacterium]|nr:exonuclease SbcCD subunit D C-terminal domain-containing protein [Zoogloeaceae bacterium]
MKLLHTSDWHLGRTLYGRKRYEEFEAFLHWLAETIRQREIDVLLVAGDVFDVSAPGNRAQALYYRFLCQVAASDCRHVVIIAGNHDSPSFLDAPRMLLAALDIHVVGCVSENPADEVLTLNDAAGAPELIVCAVPYLRDRDMRVAEAGESAEDKARKLADGIRAHYATIAALAEQKRATLNPAEKIPVVGMGHLFTTGGQTIEGDGVRERYVGSLAHVSAGIFSDVFDYLALGHLHVPQKAGDSESMRYSGSPLPMGFGEAKQQKSVCLVEFQGTTATVQTLPVPTFQKLERVRGDWPTLSERLRELATSDVPAWLEVVYESDELIGDLRERLDAAITGTALEILRVKNNAIARRALTQTHAEETLDDLSEEEVFTRCLTAHAIASAQQPELLRAYREIRQSLFEEEGEGLSGENETQKIG